MKLRMIVLTAMTILSTRAAHASIAFDTINYGAAINFSGPSYDMSTEPAQSFTTSSRLDFAAISVELVATDPTDGGSAMVYLIGDDGSGSVGVAGFPDFGNIELIGTIADSLISDGSTGTSVFTFANVPNLATTQNNEYWVYIDFASGSSSGAWAYNFDGTGIGTDNQLAFNDALGGTYPIDGSSGTGPFALGTDSVDGSNGAGPFALVVNTPEPASVALLGAAMAGLGLLRRRRKAPAA